MLNRQLNQNIFTSTMLWYHYSSSIFCSITNQLRDKSSIKVIQLADSFLTCFTHLFDFLFLILKKWDDDYYVKKKCYLSKNDSYIWDHKSLNLDSALWSFSAFSGTELNQPNISGFSTNFVAFHNVFFWFPHVNVFMKTLRAVWVQEQQRANVWSCFSS